MRVLCTLPSGRTFKATVAVMPGMPLPDRMSVLVEGRLVEVKVEAL